MPAHSMPAHSFQSAPAAARIAGRTCRPRRPPGRRGPDAAVTSLRDTARSRVSASLTADSDVPPRSKKWSRRPICSCGMPSTFGQGGRQPPFGRGRGRVVAVLDGAELGGQSRQGLLVDLAVGRQRQMLPPVKRRRHHVLRQRLSQPVPARHRCRVAAGWSRRPPDACSDRPAPQPPPHRHEPPAPATSVFSISPSSIRKPRIFSCESRRPKNSNLPSGRQRP